MRQIDAHGLHYRELNEKLRSELLKGYRKFQINNVIGQRYIGAGIVSKNASITINGIPGNNLSAFSHFSYIKVLNNAQDGVANTMNGGRVSIHGSAGDVLGHSMRMGEIYVRDNVGCRAGIHIKGTAHEGPTIVIGGTAGDFLGEYMAGGKIIILGLNDEPCGRYIATGMHGGEIFLKGSLLPTKISSGIKVNKLNDKDKEFIKEIIYTYAEEFNLGPIDISIEDFIKMSPVGNRPYGKMYAHL